MHVCTRSDPMHVQRTPTLHLCNISNPPTPRAPCVCIHQRTCMHALPGMHATVHPAMDSHAFHTVQFTHAPPCTCTRMHSPHASMRAPCMCTPPIAIYDIQIYITHPCMHACLHAHAHAHAHACAPPALAQFARSRGFDVRFCDPRSRDSVRGRG